MGTIPSIGGGSSGAGGWVKIKDVSVPGGSVTTKVYQDAPNNTILQSCTVSGTSIELDIAASYPIVDIGGSLSTLPESADGGHYVGTIAHTIAGAGPLAVTVQSANNEPGAVDAIDLSLEEPPQILSLEFTGGYPGAQTELKAGDAFQITGTTDKDLDAIDIQAFGAFDASLEVVAVGTTFTVSGTIADQGLATQALAGRARARDAVTGALGPARDTNQGGGTVDGTDLVNLNNTYPTVSFGVITYPAAQQALKDGEAATLAVSTANLDTILYDSPTSEIQVTSPTLDEATKTCTRINGAYNIATSNVRASANRAANDATTVELGVINIAHVDAVITVTPPAARLRSGGNDGTLVQNHTITISGDQELLSVALDEDTGGGTFTGSWVGGPTNWTRVLQVADDDTKGTYNWQNLAATNLAGKVASSISVGGSYVLGGFVARSLTFAAFATTTQMDVEVVDFAKLQAGIFTATNQTALKQSIGTPPSVINGYTIDSTGVKPTTVVWLDTAAASTNSTGTAQITDVEELV